MKMKYSIKDIAQTILLLALAIALFGLLATNAHAQTTTCTTLEGFTSCNSVYTDKDGQLQNDISYVQSNGAGQTIIQTEKRD